MSNIFKKIVFRYILLFCIVISVFFTGQTALCIDMKTNENRQKKIFKHTQKKTNRAHKKTKLKKKKKSGETKVILLDDSNISSLIDMQQKIILQPRKISVATKNKGVPNICLGIPVKKKEQNNKQYKPSIPNKALENAKKNLKRHIKYSLEANEIDKDLVKYIHNHLEYHKPSEQKHKEIIKRKMIDFIKNYKVAERVKTGKEYKKKYKDTLMEVENLFDVDANVILSIWGMETNYGNFIGNNDAFNALYSACMNAQSIERLRYFEKNIIFLAKLVDYGFFTKDVISSFDGGLGGCQFMPDSFYKYAVSLKGDKADIINNNEDVFASIANYVHSMGWRYKQGVITEITLPDNFDPCLIGMNTVKTVKEWENLGVKAHKNKIGKQHMKDYNAKASIIVTDPNDSIEETPEKRAFLVYDNYKVIMGYNRQLAYGLTTGLIFEGIGD